MSAEQDLRSHLVSLEAAGERIVRVSRPVSLDRELSAVVKHLESRGNPVVIFERVRGSTMPVIVGVNGTRRRIGLALDCTPDELTDAYLERLARPIEPVEVANGPVKEVRMVGADVDLGRLPIPTHAADDSGPYLTSGVGLARDPDSGAVNAGIYRMEVRGRNRLTVGADVGADLSRIVARRAELGARQEFAVVLGHHPALMIASQAHVPLDQDTLAVSGAILGRPLAMVAGESIGELVPARAEIVIEGFFLGTDRVQDGPFGEFPYYYNSYDGFVLEVTAITHRHDAIFQDVHNVHPEHRNLSIVPNREAELLATLRRSFGNVRACHILAASAGLHAYISMQPRREGEAKRAIMLALGSTVYLKQVVAVDLDIDIWDLEQLQWAVATRSQPDRDWFMIPYSIGHGSDPSSYGYDTRTPRGGPNAVHDNHALTTLVGIDATMPVQAPYAKRADILPAEFANLDVDAILRDSGSGS